MIRVLVLGPWLVELPFFLYRNQNHLARSFVGYLVPRRKKVLCVCPEDRQQLSLVVGLSRFDHTLDGLFSGRKPFLCLLCCAVLRRRSRHNDQEPKSGKPRVPTSKDEMTHGVLPYRHFEIAERVRDLCR